MGFCPSLFLPWLLSKGVYKRQGLALYPVSVVLPFLEDKQEADCKSLPWSPPISCLRKWKQETSCTCLTQSPSVSCLRLAAPWIHGPCLPFPTVYLALKGRDCLVGNLLTLVDSLSDWAHAELSKDFLEGQLVIVWCFAGSVTLLAATQLCHFNSCVVWTLGERRGLGTSEPWCVEMASLL